MIRKYIHYPDTDIFAIYYAKQKIIYYNLNFNGKTKIYVVQ